MKKYTGSCHCGAVKFEAEMEIEEGVSCNCSICHRKGSVLTFVPEMKFKLLSGEDKLTDYQFGKKRIHHTFCSVCGVSAFGWAEMKPGEKMRAINIRCLDNVDLKDIKIKEYNGKDL